MNNLKEVVLMVVVLLFVSCNTTSNKTQKLTGVNPISYTDVAYISEKDTVIVSTYSGRIAKRIKGDKKEEVLAQINDEIYSLAYSEKTNEIIASTLASGILILDAKSRNIKRRLATGESWINNIQLSNDRKYLMGYNGKGENFVWDIYTNYERMIYPESFTGGLIRFGKSNKLYHSYYDKMVIWNLENHTITTQKINQGRLVDVDDANNKLLIHRNKFTIQSATGDTTKTMSKKHPDWPYYQSGKDTIYRIPIQMELTVGCFAKNTICTGGFDRSIRFWNKTTGDLEGELLTHRATISSIKVSKDQNQMVSVDLKGGIHFTDIN
ncbi:hypothetical protein ABW636_14980 [Aquimarina sp. 2201CG1-2-11]|uniref:hypothetical protein n=1 Tax=Aquimarina discodermiae TaxID=3231043 RepID=UPI0034618A3C